MRSRAVQAILFIVGYSMFVTCMIGAYWYFLIPIASVDILHGDLAERALSCFFVAIGLIGTVYWVKMVMDVYLVIKNIFRKEKMWRDCVGSIR